jgi:hypothetical protein
MGTPYLIDTNIAIYLLNGTLPDQVLQNLRTLLLPECNLAIITKIEVLGWRFPNEAEQTAATNFIFAANTYRLTDPIADQTILIR